MLNFTELASVLSDRLVPVTDQLRLAVAACLASFKGSSREYTESDPAQYVKSRAPVVIAGPIGHKWAG
jgi:hypothetical protein